MAVDEFDERGRSPRGVRQANELVLAEGEYAYIQDTTKGVTQVKTGPAVLNLQGQDRPVLYNGKTRRFDEVPLASAAQINIVVPKGFYAVLQNPAVSRQNRHPTAANTQPASDLLIGQRELLSGPVSFALWPRQMADVIEGHQLRLNQYLVIRVYDEEAARQNWTSAVIKKAAGTEDTKEPEVTSEIAVSQQTPKDLSVGRMLIIRGTEVSFYIPPTGIEVVQDENGKYLREALTLERLQYCILVDESGNKKYVRGPDVVFPLPTQRFHTNEDQERRFRPIELNGRIQGIHVKVIAAYKDENGDHGPKGREYKEGEELFITGDTTPIYFPCEQHSAIKYDGRTRHFATAIPAGDGRYVLDRLTGKIEMVTGGESGTMVMPDPRKEVFVRRVLAEAECSLLYPGNSQVVEFNKTLSDLQKNTPTTRRGLVSEGEVTRARGGRGRPESLSLESTHFADVSPAYSNTNAEMGGDEFSRPATYTDPRMVTLGNDKFAGVPKIDLWTGYAVMVKDTAGNRRVEVGPRRVLLDFNETLEALTLSTGKPKTTDTLLKTAYLQTVHNKVSDIVRADTKDHVSVSIKFALRVNFEGTEPEKWFQVANYVKLLSDHARSVLKSAVRKVTVDEFFVRSEDFVRDSLLGAKPEDGSGRKGMFFEENSMRVYDVEVLNVEIGDPQIQQLLSLAQHQTVETGIRLASAKQQLNATQQSEEIRRLEAEAQASTAEHAAKLTIQKISRDLQLGLELIAAEVRKAEQNLISVQVKESINDFTAEADRNRKQANAAVDLTVARDQQVLREQWLRQETASNVERLAACQTGFAEALLALGNQDTLVKVAQAMSVQQFLGGKDLPEVVGRVFAGTPLAGLASIVMERATGGQKTLGANGNGASASR